MRYPITVHREKSGSCWLSFPDCPGVFTWGDSVDDAMSHALDAWESMYMYVLGTDDLVPLPTPVKRRQKWLDVPPSIAAKVLLHNEMVKQKVRPNDLARRMGIPQEELMRVLSLKYKTKIETVAEALNALGKHFEFRLIQLSSGGR